MLYEVITGLAITIQQSLNLAFGPDVRTVQSGFGSLELFGGVIEITQIVITSYSIHYTKLYDPQRTPPLSRTSTTIRLTSFCAPRRWAAGAL